VTAERLRIVVEAVRDGEVRAASTGVVELRPAHVRCPNHSFRSAAVSAVIRGYDITCQS